LRLVVLHDEQPLDPPLEKALYRLQRLRELALVDGLSEHRYGAVLEAAPLRGVRRRDDVHGDVTCRGVVLQAIQHEPPVHIGQPQIQGDRVGLDLLDELQRGATRLGGHRLEAMLAGHVDERAREHLIVLHDHQDAVARRDVLAIVGDVGRVRGGARR
jgi:hypothetical protein